MSESKAQSRWQRWYPWIQFLSGVMAGILFVDYVYGLGERAGQDKCRD